MEHGLHGFIPKLKWSIAATYFDNLEILAAEDNICDFERDYEIFFRSLKLVLSYYRNCQKPPTFVVETDLQKLQ